MPTTTEVWTMKLDSPPTVTAMSPRAIHGARGVERYRVNVWALNCYQQGEGTLKIAGATHGVRRGCVSLTAPDHDMEYVYRGRALLTWAHLRAAGDAKGARPPVVIDLKGRFESFRSAMEHAAIAHHRNPERATTGVWDLLWRLAELVQEPDADAPHPALAEALEYLDTYFVEPVEISSLARRLGISPTHLNRLFKQSTCVTATAYLRKRRVAHARYLLASTNLPMKALAARVGLTDEHHLNELMRRETGMPPSQLRRLVR
jgi:AraC-like DNA-binding protein